MQGITSTSEIDPTKKAIDKPEEEPKLAAIPKDAPVVRVGLRRQPVLITNQMQIKDMLMEYDFFDQSKNAYGAFVNGFIDNNDGTVTDRATGLMWQKNGSPSRLNNRKAKEYINKLKKQRFAGYSDWRMPTIEELASLLARKSNKGVHIAPEFETHQFSCWSADKCRPLTDYFVGYWIVNFKQGQILESSIQKSSVMPSVRMSGNKNVTNYVKAVRSVR
jgi:hypothetical protein